MTNTDRAKLAEEVRARVQAALDGQAWVAIPEGATVPVVEPWIVVRDEWDEGDTLYAHEAPVDTEWVSMARRANYPATYYVRASDLPRLTYPDPDPDQAVLDAIKLGLHAPDPTALRAEHVIEPRAVQGMTAPLDLDAIRARADAATEGPWAPWLDLDGTPHMQGMLMVGNAAAVIPPGQCWIEGVDVNPIAHTHTPEDRAFIAHARQDIPALLDRIRDLEAAIARVRAPHALPVPHHPRPRRERVVIARLLVRLGLRSSCCHARLIRPYGWPPSYAACASCHRRARR